MCGEGEGGGCSGARSNDDRLEVHDLVFKLRETKTTTLRFRVYIYIYRCLFL